MMFKKQNQRIDELRKDVQELTDKLRRAVPQPSECAKPSRKAETRPDYEPRALPPSGGRPVIHGL